MISRPQCISAAEGIWRIRSGNFNSYALVADRRVLLVDPVAGWTRPQLRAIGGSEVDAILFTRPDRARLRAGAAWPAPIHLSGLSRQLLTADFLAACQHPPLRSPVAPFYDPPLSPPGRALFDLQEGGNFVWRGRVFWFLPTPGHTTAALSILLEGARDVFCFCGDAVAEKGRLWHPHHLEWDHWTSAGIRAAIHGLDRLGQMPITCLLPARGEIVERKINTTIRSLRKNLETWALAKESFVPAISAPSWPAEDAGCGARRLLPHLYHLGASAYLVAGNGGEGLLIDATPNQEQVLRHILKLAKIKRITATATHYHCDHTDGLEHWRGKIRAKIALPRMLSRIVCRPDRWPSLPFRGERLLRPPEIYPKPEHPVTIAGLGVTWHDLPGQTRFHMGIEVLVDNTKVFFTGDNFFSPLRYNGSGGCSVANESRPEQYAFSARLVRRLRPALVAAGHGCAFRYTQAYFEAVEKWARRYRRALEKLRFPGDQSGYFAPSRTP